MVASAAQNAALEEEERIQVIQLVSESDTVVGLKSTGKAVGAAGR